MTKQGINNSAKETSKKKKIIKKIKITLVIAMLILINIYIILWFFYREKSFTVYLDKKYPFEYNLTIYENKEEKFERDFLRAESMKNFSDMTIDWLPENINNESDGSHNGNNYMAYTFYAENQGHETINYTATIQIDDVVKNLDEAVRVLVYKNNQRTVYAKINSETGEPEENTQRFVDNTIVMKENNYNFKVGDIDKYTVVIFIEGEDKDCTDALIGGEIELSMTLSEEQLPDPEPVDEVEDTN